MLLSRYKLLDVAIKAVSVGSVGTFCGIVLFVSGNGDPLFIQFKQARKSVLEPYAGASTQSHAGQRAVVGQRLMQAAGDLFLGWYTGKSDSFEGVLADFGLAYADQNERDHAALITAVRSGRVEARTQE